MAEPPAFTCTRPLSRPASRLGSGNPTLKESPDAPSHPRHRRRLLRCACFATTSTAGHHASKKTYKTKTTLVKTSDGFKGQLSSKQKKCIKNRTLKVGIPFSIGPDVVHSDRHGAWEFTRSAIPEGGTASAYVLRGGVG